MARLPTAAVEIVLEGFSADFQNFWLNRFGGIHPLGKELPSSK